METFVKTANFECYEGELFPNNSIQTFGYQFEAKRNVTFSWDSAVKTSHMTRFHFLIYLILNFVQFSYN